MFKIFVKFFLHLTRALSTCPNIYFDPFLRCLHYSGLLLSVRKHVVVFTSAMCKNQHLLLILIFDY
jgi:hypothetical protein